VASRVERFQELVGRHPEDERFRFSLAQALIAENRDAEAEPHLAFCVARKSDWMVPRILLGKLMVQLGRHVEARPLLEAALQLAVEQQHEDPERELRATLAEL